MVRKFSRFVSAVVATVFLAGSLTTLITPVVSAQTRTPRTKTVKLIDSTSPIKHVVLIYNENHTFDNVLSRVCQDAVTNGRMPCNSATTGTRSNGSTLTLKDMPDIVPDVRHLVNDQIKAVDGGKMDKFDLVPGCGATTKYACYSRATNAEIPNLYQLANKFALSDNTFSLTPMASFEQHINIGAFTSDGFIGNNPVPPKGQPNLSGWGCSSKKVTGWRASPGSPIKTVKSCIPNKAGKIPSGTTPVKYVHTIYEDLSENSQTWAVYGAKYPNGAENIWASIGTFWQLRGATDYNSVAKKNADFYTDLANNQLPNYSLIVPDGPTSQHNKYSMLRGDQAIGQYVNAIMKSPYWASTAIFVTYDDCGCFYDHVAPPAGMGLRMPLVIISPYTKPGYTDSNVASFASIGAFIEHTLGIPPVSATTPDGTAYDFSDSFDFTIVPTTRSFKAVNKPLPASTSKGSNYQDTDET